MDTLDLRSAVTLVLFLAFLAPLAGCGDDTPPPPADAVVTTGPPGSVEVVVQTMHGSPGYKHEVRLLKPPQAGSSESRAEDGSVMITIPSDKEVVEGPDMLVVASGEADGSGKVRLTNVPPGRYLLSAGNLGAGIHRQWVVVEPGKNLSLSFKLPGPRKVPPRT